MHTVENATETSENQADLGGFYVSGIQRGCPTCRRFSPKLIHQRSIEGGMQFTNREVCFNVGTLDPSPCKHDAIIGTLLVTNEILREKLNHSQDEMTCEQKSERHRLKSQLENPARYWCWLTVGRVA